MLQYLKALPVAAVACLLVACAVVPGVPVLPPTVAPDTRIDMRDVSFLPPQERTWYVIVHEPFKVELGTDGMNLDETFAVQASYFEVPAFDNEEDFLTFVDENLSMQDTERFTHLDHETTRRRVAGIACLERYTAVEDRAAKKRTSRTDPMVLYVDSLYCMHPSQPGVALNLAYSVRRYPEDGDPDVRATGRKMFGTLRIEREPAENP